MTLHLGYLASAFMFLGALLLPLIAWRLGASPVAAFWVAYVLTRPAGALFADYFGMPKDISGLGLGHAAVSAVLIVLVAAGIWLLKVSGKDAQRPPVAAQSAVRPARTVLAVFIRILAGSPEKPPRWNYGALRFPGNGWLTEHISRVPAMARAAPAKPCRELLRAGC